MDLNSISVNTGDIVLFRYIPFYIFHHMGTVIKINNKLYIFESTAEVGYDEMTKRMKSGTKLVDFHKKVKEYPGKVYLYKTNFNKNQQRRIMDNIYKFKDVPFIKSPIDFIRDRDIKKGGVSCIEIVYKLFKKAGLINKEISYILFSEMLDKNTYNFDFRITDKYLIKDI